MDHINELTERLSLAKVRRAPHETPWQEISDLMNPFRGDFTTKKAKGSKRVGAVFDSTAQQSADTFVNFFKGQLFPSSDSHWLRTRAPYDHRHNNELRLLLDATQERMLYNLTSSNFYVASTPALRDLSIIGNSVFHVDTDEENNLIFEAVPLSDCWWLTGKAGRVVFFAREFKIPAIDAIRFFEGKGGKAGAAAYEIANKNPMQLVTYTQFIYRNEKQIKAKRALRTAENKPWVSEWVCMEVKPEIVRRSGYDRNPYVVSRYQVVDGEEYGRGRGHLVRSDARGINELKRLVLIATGRDLSPPLMVSDDSFLKLNVGPNSTSVIRRGADDPRFLRSGADYQAADMIAREDRAQIRQGFMADALMDPDTQPRSAEESVQRRFRALQRLAAPSETVAKEFLDPVVDLIFSAMLEAGQLPELEEAARIIGDGEITYEYTSPLFKAQQASTVDAMWAFVERRLNIFQATQDHRYLDDLDPDAISQVDRELTGVSAEIFLSDEDRQARREARAQQEAMQQELEMAQQQGGQFAGA